MMHFTTLHVWCLVPAAAITAAQSASELFMHPANRRGCRYCFKHTGLLTALKKCKYLSPYLGSKHSACYRIYNLSFMYLTSNDDQFILQEICLLCAVFIQCSLFCMQMLWTCRYGCFHWSTRRGWTMLTFLGRGPIQLLQSNPKSNSIQF